MNRNEHDDGVDIVKRDFECIAWLIRIVLNQPVPK